MKQESFNIIAVDGKITLVGDLDNLSSFYYKDSNDFSQFAEFTGPKIIIVSDNILLSPKGVSDWLSFVNKFLSDCKLIYAPSQLSFILQFDDRYKHPRTVFLEDTEFQQMNQDVKRSSAISYQQPILPV